MEKASEVKYIKKGGDDVKDKLHLTILLRNDPGIWLMMVIYF